MSAPKPAPPAPSEDASGRGAGGLAQVVARNIEALLERQRSEERAQPAQARVAAAITRFTGSMPFVYIHLAIFGAWIVANLKITPLPKFDPSLVILAMVASVEAIFLSTFVLITQNRLAADADRRAQLDLHISLLAEHEITRLIALTSDIARKLEVPIHDEAHVSELKHDVSPEDVLTEIDDQTAKTPPATR